MTSTATPVNNGVNVGALLGARKALTMRRKRRSSTGGPRTSGCNGTHSKTTIERYFGLGDEQEHRISYTADHPEVFASEDSPRRPSSTSSSGSAGCLTAGVAAVAQNREIQLDWVTATVEGAMDVRGILGGDPEIRNGFSTSKVSYEIDADASPTSSGARCAVAEALRGLRRDHQPDRRPVEVG